MVSELISIVKHIVTIVVSLATPFLVYIQLNKYRSEKATELHEKYTLLKSLMNDHESNLPEVLIVLKGISKADFSTKEIKWFINEPGAFVKLKEYGRLKWRYSRIDFDKGEFDVQERISTAPRIAREMLSILLFFFSFIVIFGVLTQWMFTGFYGETETTAYLLIIVRLLNLAIATYGMLYLLKAINSAISLKGKPQPCDK